MTTGDARAFSGATSGVVPARWLCVAIKMTSPLT